MAKRSATTTFGAGKKTTVTASNTSSNVSSNTGTANTSNTTTGTKKSTTKTGSNRQHITNSNTQVVSTNTNKFTPVPNVKVKEKSILSGLFGTPTVVNAPYAQTQNRKFLTNSESQISKSEQPANKAQAEKFTYAMDKSGNTYVITSQLSLQQRQDLAKQGIVTNSIPYVTTGFASVPTGIDPSGHVRYADEDKQITVDEKLANQSYLYYDLSETQGMETIDPIDKEDDGFTPNQNDHLEESDESNGVQFIGNTFGSDGATTDKADERYNDGSTLTTQKDDPLIVELLAGQKKDEQWMNQINSQIVALQNYQAFSNNGKNGGNGVYSNGNRQKNGNGKTNGNGMANLEATFGKITGSKYFPIVIVGIIVLMVIGFLKPKAAAGIPSAPSKVFQFA